MAAHWIRLLGLAGVILGAACQEKLDTTRQPVDNGTFGETIYTLACKRVAYLEDRADGDGRVDVSGETYRDFCRHGGPAPAGLYPRVAALAMQRDELILALDTAFPDAELGDVQDYVTTNEFLSLYDDHLAEDAVDRQARVFDMMATDPEFQSAIARLDIRLGYRPGKAQLGSLRAFVNYDALDQFLADALAAVDEGGSAHETFVTLVTAAGAEMEDAVEVPDPDADDRTLRLGLDLLLAESPRLGNGRVRLLTSRDSRGLAIVLPDGATLPSPFIDGNGDGLADADDFGRFLSASGPIEPVTTPFKLLAGDTQPRDADGRALNASGGPLYRYVDLDRTLLVALAHESRELLSPSRGTALDLLRGASVLLGPRQTVTKSFSRRPTLDYLGYDTTQSALLDMVYGYLNLLNDPRIFETLDLARLLIDTREPQAARLIEALVHAADLGNQYPDARIEPGSPLYDDLIPVVNEILAVPGLAEALLIALEDPAVRPLAERFSAMMKHKDRISYNASKQVVGSLVTPVDRAMADSGWNRSVFQRVLHLIADADGVRFCNKQGAQISFLGFTLPIVDWDECDLLDIPDLAVFFLQSIAYARDSDGDFIFENGGYRPKAKLPLSSDVTWVPGLSTFLENDSGITGFREYPTPQALGRVLFLPGLYPSSGSTYISKITNPARCKDGERFDQVHADSLQAFELDGFYGQIRPIIQVFADRNQEKLFVKVLSVLHKHWPSPASLDHQSTNPSGTRYARMSNAQSYEPLIAAIVDAKLLWPALTEDAAVINHLTVSTRQGYQIITAGARWLFAPQAGLTNRIGASATTTDDGRPVTTLSPWYLLADGYRLKQEQIAESGGEGALWDEATSELVDNLVRGEKALSGWRFRNPRFRGVAVALIDFVRGRIQAHQGDLGTWTRRKLVGDLESLFGGPVFAGAANFVLALSASPEARVALEDLFVYLTTDSGGDAFVTAITAAADLSQLFLDDRDLVPVARLAGKALSPELGMVSSQVAFLHRARIADTGGTLPRMMRGMFTEHTPGRTSLATVVDAICAVNRLDPLGDAGKYLTPEDFRAIFTAVGGFLDDNKRGLRSFVRVVENRNIK